MKTQKTPSTHPAAPANHPLGKLPLVLVAGLLAIGGNPAKADQVIADDLIVQGSECVGVDCVNNEDFGFDTLRLKENNLRIKFEDTSVGSFPTTDWQLTANDSASGGANKFSIEDVTAGRVPFTILGGAPNNSLFVNGAGRVGFGTATPAVDLHTVSGNTPTLRLDQDGSAGFTPQAWDVAGNEANFFIRDVTNGSTLPFRIRPGAPSSSIDITASGNVGIGLDGATAKLHVRQNTNANIFALVDNQTSGSNAAAVLRASSDTATVNFQAHSNARTINRFGETLGGWAEFLQVSGNGLIVGTFPATPLILGTSGANRVFIANNGNVGFGGISNPTNPIQHANGAHLTPGGVWTNASSRELKDKIHALTPSEAAQTLAGLQPVHYQYKAEPGEDYLGFVAEDVPDAVATADRKGLNPMDIVAVLTKVVQEQQRTIEQLNRKVTFLENTRSQ